MLFEVVSPITDFSVINVSILFLLLIQCGSHFEISFCEVRITNFFVFGREFVSLRKFHDDIQSKVFTCTVLLPASFSPNSISDSCAINSETEINWLSIHSASNSTTKTCQHSVFSGLHV